ncbi:MAG: GNAT family N-acetyltransferase [Anaerolineae bacterium]|nr:GNAT family N-acetyltransferase [Anaerolineae bacterium]
MSPGDLVSTTLPEAIEVRRFQPGDAAVVSAMMRQVFDQHVSPTFEPEGIEEMHRHVSAEAIAERAATHATFVAWQDALPAGVIEVRDTTHVSMLFVRTSHMGLGIATALIVRAEEACRAAGLERMTVHSSVNATSFYGRLGFQATHEPQHVHGFSFVPMEKRLDLEKEGA